MDIKEKSNLIIKELIDELSIMMENSYKYCEHEDVNIAKTLSNINNSAFNLKFKAELLKKYINQL